MATHSPTPVLLPRKFHGWRSLVGYSPRGGKELDMIERLHFLSFYVCIVGNGIRWVDEERAKKRCISSWGNGQLELLLISGKGMDTCRGVRENHSVERA